VCLLNLADMDEVEFIDGKGDKRSFELNTKKMVLF
jgi:hypothetical protein